MADKLNQKKMEQFIGTKSKNSSGRRAPGMLNKMFKETFEMEKTLKRRNI